MTQGTSVMMDLVGFYRGCDMRSEEYSSCSQDWKKLFLWFRKVLVKMWYLGKSARFGGPKFFWFLFLVPNFLEILKKKFGKKSKNGQKMAKIGQKWAKIAKNCHFLAKIDTFLGFSFGPKYFKETKKALKLVFWTTYNLC